MTYIEQLTDEQLLRLHKECQFSSIEPRVERLVFGGYSNCTFYELVDDEEGAFYYETTYHYYDFSRPECVDATDLPFDTNKYFALMIEFFGNAYLRDLIKNKLNVNDEFVNKYLSL